MVALISFYFHFQSMAPARPFAFLGFTHTPTHLLPLPDIARASALSTSSCTRALDMDCFRLPWVNTDSSTTATTTVSPVSTQRLIRLMLPPTRPARITELANAAQADPDVSSGSTSGLKHYLQRAEVHRKAGKALVSGAGAAADVGAEMERAFIEYACAMKLILENVPNHKDYTSALTPMQKANLSAVKRRRHPERNGLDQGRARRPLRALCA
ncbi:hypothetical protein DFH07DRAFT_572295 [Mycena maculata]|uniref:USP8 dimerisation domain-containing protein n=1 Tax=Mycena maculata TaxID=230809 RepID=A0AAD7IRS7_9AGAR|nr:hypothetical protein DFH07DRAFT_572295 [Mycena maculata]